MEKLPRDSFLEYNKNTLQEVRKAFNLDKPGELEDVVNILDAWVKEQPHFTKTNFERRYLETTIICSKGSIELAKSRLDRGCTIRTLMLHNFGIHDVRYLYKTDIYDILHAPLPKMTKNNERVYVIRMLDTNKFSDTAMDNFIRTFPYFGEYLRLNDYAESNNMIIDYAEANLLDCARILTMNAAQETVAYLLDCCGFRVKGIYLISSSKFIGLIVGIFKQVLSAKLADRVHVLKDRKSAAAVFDKDILPIEYGGTEMPLKDLQGRYASAVMMLNSQGTLLSIQNLVAFYDIRCRGDAILTRHHRKQVTLLPIPWIYTLVAFYDNRKKKWCDTILTRHHTVTIIIEKWIDAVSSEKHVQYLKDINSARTDEDRRQSAKFNAEYMGMPGSFRKLAVD